MKVVGLMSGTSADAVDAALVEIHGAGEQLAVTQLAFTTLPYPTTLRRRILAVCNQGTVTEVCHLNAVLGEWFAKAALRVIQRARLKPEEVQLIGSHGQTVQHLPVPRPEPGLGRIRSTLQIGEPAVIAERTGITTVANFRPRDIAAGGEGAPLAPYVHHLLLRHPDRTRMIVNLGGISNVTYLPPKNDIETVIAFDTGPGNMVLDALMVHLTKGRQTMDRGGCTAAKGLVDEPLLRQWLRHPFFRRRPPKSTGREEFGSAFMSGILSAARRRRISREDLLATATRLTARVVAEARRWLPSPVEEVIVGGGGARNATLMAQLADECRPASVRTFEEAGWDSKAFEAVAFAVLAYQTFHGEYANVPGATGARHQVLLGTIVPATQHQPVHS